MYAWHVKYKTEETHLIKLVVTFAEMKCENKYSNENNSKLNKW